MLANEFSRGDPFVHRADQAAQDQANQRHWSPYSWHGGTVLAIAGEDFAIIASDTRLGEHGGIYTRELNRNTQGKNNADESLKLHKNGGGILKYFFVCNF
jgi:hypothetical protein